MPRSLFYLFLLLFISCKPDEKQMEKNFDIPLLQQNEKFRLEGEYDSLVNLNKEYYRKAEKLGYEEGKALCYINLARVNISLENYQKSYILFNNAEEILKNSDNFLHKTVFYTNYCRFNIELNRIDQAFEYNHLAMEHIQKIKNSELKRYLLYNINLLQGEYYVHKKQDREALEYFHKASRLDDTGNADCSISDYIYMYGAYKNRDSAYKYIRRAYNKMAIRKREDAVSLRIHTIKGEYYLTYSEYDKAEKEFIKALEIDQKTKRIFAHYTKFIYNDLRNLYAGKGDPEKAYLYLNAYTAAKNKTNKALLATINHDMESFIAESKEDSEKAARKIRWVIFFSFTGLLVLAIYAWRIINILKKRKKDLKSETEYLKNKINDNRQEEIIEMVKRNDPEFLNSFKKIYPEFINKLLTINPNLEDSELAFCAMLKLHFTSKEVASYTLIQHRTVQQKKYRIRKRLNIPTEIDIYQFFDDLK